MRLYILGIKSIQNDSVTQAALFKIHVINKFDTLSPFSPKCTFFFKAKHIAVIF